MKKHLYLPKVHLLVYVYYLPIYVACEKYPYDPLHVSELYYHTYAHSVSHGITLFVLILRFCIVYWLILKYYELYLIIVNCSLLHLVMCKGFPCSQLILYDVWSSDIYTATPVTVRYEIHSQLEFCYLYSDGCVCRIRAIVKHKKML